MDNGWGAVVGVYDLSRGESEKMKTTILKSKSSKCVFCKHKLEAGERVYKSIGEVVDVVCSDCIQDYIESENDFS